MLVLLLAACVVAPRFPGPLGPVGRTPGILTVERSNEGTVAAVRGAMPLAEDIAESGRYYLEAKPHLPRNDCSGLVEAAMDHAGLHLEGSAANLWALAEDQGRTHKGRARPGDLVLFDHTYDRNSNGKRDDYLTHVALVIGVDPDGTVHMVHKGASTGISELLMNLDHPHDRSVDGKLVNSWIAKVGWSAPGGGRLTAETFHGYATFAEQGQPERVAATRPAHRSRRSAPPEPSLPTDLPAFAVIMDGGRLRHRELDAVGCDDLRMLRQTVFARHGYVFHDPGVQARFAGQPWYAPDPGVDGTGVQALLTGPDQYSIDRIDARTARRCGP